MTFHTHQNNKIPDLKNLSIDISCHYYGWAGHGYPSETSDFTVGFLFIGVHVARALGFFCYVSCSLPSVLECFYFSVRHKVNEIVNVYSVHVLAMYLIYVHEFIHI